MTTLHTSAGDDVAGLLHTLTRMLGGIGHTVRLEILLLLADEPKFVSQMADEMELDCAYVSQQLKLLRELDLVHSEAMSNRRRYRLTPRVRVSRDAHMTISMVAGAGHIVLVVPPTTARGSDRAPALGA